MTNQNDISSLYLANLQREKYNGQTQRMPIKKPPMKLSNLKTSWKIFFGLAVLIVIAAVILYTIHKANEGFFMKTPTKTVESVSYGAGTKQIANPTLGATGLPIKVLLNDNYYIGQSFNNCGPAALSMDLSFYGVDVSQEALADILRPDHNETGTNDEKSTPPEDLAAQAEQYDGLIAYYRPAGNIDLLKKLVAAGFPVMVRTLYKPTDMVAHYRVIKGYDDTTGDIIDEDGFQGPNVHYTYNDFLSLWKYYNYEYIVLTPPSKQAQLEAILGSEVSSQSSWQLAAQNAEADIAYDSSDVLATFNLSVADYYLGDYADSVKEFEAAQATGQLPPDMLWYQIEPIESYYELGQYDKVFSLSQGVFDQGDIAVPELYVLRGQSYEKQGNTTAAKAQFELALQYNKNLQSAKDALAALGS
jgi:tetratricopeptide (TPR) repeat protein